MNIKNYIWRSAGVMALASIFLGTAPTVTAQTFSDYMNDARTALQQYDFSLTSKYLGEAKKKLKGEDEAERDELAECERQLNLAKSFMQRVEHLEIIDSITVPKESFFRAYRLPSSAGSIEGSEGLPVKVENVETVFTNEEGDFKMWAQPDTTGFYNIAESILLTDGNWSDPTIAPPSLGDNGNAEFPFMMADGVTLYFASDGDGSMGGYDIFVATRDAQTGEYLQPQNIGMPYNSPFDDYLLAIDELNGVGWWATDRNQLADDLTVYVYRLNDVRRNYDPDEEDGDIRDLAFITDYKATQDTEADYTPLLNEIKAIKTDRKKKVDFHFPRKGGGEYTTLDDFSTSGGRSAMTRFLEAEKKLKKELAHLDSLRRQYADSPSPEIKQTIRRMENETENAREELKRLKNEVYKAEGN